jgi:hypothetical protein
MDALHVFPSMLAGVRARGTPIRNSPPGAEDDPSIRLFEASRTDPRLFRAAQGFSIHPSAERGRFTTETQRGLARNRPGALFEYRSVEPGDVHHRDTEDTEGPRTLRALCVSVVIGPPRCSERSRIFAQRISRFVVQRARRTTEKSFLAFLCGPAFAAQNALARRLRTESAFPRRSGVS